MDTNQAINTIKSLLNNMEGNINGLTSQKDILLLALSQLEGTLKTQLLSLTPEQLQSFPEVIAINKTNSDLSAMVDTLNANIADKNDTIINLGNTIISKDNEIATLNEKIDELTIVAPTPVVEPVLPTDEVTA